MPELELKKIILSKTESLIAEILAKDYKNDAVKKISVCKCLYIFLKKRKGFMKMD